MKLEDSLLAAALDYAKRGRYVIPLHNPTQTGGCSCGNPNCNSIGKHPRIKDWQNQATTDPQQIIKWWTQSPDANIGIVTGKKSGLVVLDVDPRHGGDETLAELEKIYGPLPETIESLTGGGGRHILFSHPGGEVPNLAGSIGSGLDLRGDGGHIVAPASLHSSGKTYEWEASHHPDETKLAPLPDWMLDLIRNNKRSSAGPNNGQSDQITEGMRNSALTSVAGSLRKYGLALTGIEAALKTFNEGWCEPPLPEKEIINISNSIGKKPVGIQVSHPWPKPSEEVYYGLAREIIKLIEPQTEADPMAILSQLLAAFGNVIGRGPYFKVGEDKHYPQLFILVIGKTGEGRKGTAFRIVKSIFEHVDPKWVSNCLPTGLSSGEGLIWEVRDPIFEMKQGKEVCVDKGESDKRRLVVEEEFSSVLKMISREGNILSQVVRRSWDAGDLQTMTKSSSARATNAYISLVGHCTEEEISRYLTATEMANGFINRFNIICSKRSIDLPLGGNIDQVKMAPLTARLIEAVEFARGTSEVRMDSDAETLWKSVYHELAKGKPGLFGAIVGRATAQILRVALIYALLDKSKWIRVPHLKAALAFWRYCEDSARYLFGEKLGDPVADRILDALRNQQRGLSRTEISRMFKNNMNKLVIDRALNFLIESGLIDFKTEKTNGRDAIRFFAVTN